MRVRAWLLAFVFWVLPVCAQAADARVVSVSDGDTFRVVMLAAHDGEVVLARGHNVAVRVRGVDTPELRARCRSELRKARAARDFVVKLLPVGTVVQLTRIGRDKYPGRVDARVRLADGRELAKLLIAAGLGRVYDGGRRESWCR